MVVSKVFVRTLSKQDAVTAGSVRGSGDVHGAIVAVTVTDRPQLAALAVFDVDDMYDVHRFINFKLPLE